MRMYNTYARTRALALHAHTHTHVARVREVHRWCARGCRWRVTRSGKANEEGLKREPHTGGNARPVEKGERESPERPEPRRVEARRWTAVG